MLNFVVLSALLASACAVSIRAPRLDGRIVGGEDTDITIYPHQVSLEYDGEHSCGGSIIGDKWIVTAAHCTDGEVPAGIIVRAGITKLGEMGQLHIVAQIHQHPDYTSLIYDYDISLLELETPITMGPNAQPIGLVEDGFEPAANLDVTASGWGDLAEGGVGPITLQKVDMKITAKEVCQEQYGFIPLTSRMICAGVPGGGKDSCQGDSGGPLISEDKLVGVVSWGIGCARPEFSGIYANVGYLRSFIKEKSGI